MKDHERELKKVYDLKVQELEIAKKSEEKSQNEVIGKMMGDDEVTAEKKSKHESEILKNSLTQKQQEEISSLKQAIEKLEAVHKKDLEKLQADIEAKMRAECENSQKQALETIKKQMQAEIDKLKADNERLSKALQIQQQLNNAKPTDIQQASKTMPLQATITEKHSKTAHEIYSKDTKHSPSYVPSVNPDAKSAGIGSSPATTRASDTSAIKDNGSRTVKFSPKPGPTPIRVEANELYEALSQVYPPLPCPFYPFCRKFKGPTLSESGNILKAAFIGTLELCMTNPMGEKNTTNAVLKEYNISGTESMKQICNPEDTKISEGLLTKLEKPYLKKSLAKTLKGFNEKLKLPICLVTVEGENVFLEVVWNEY